MTKQSKRNQRRMHQGGLGGGFTVVRRVPIRMQRGLPQAPTLSVEAYERLRYLEYAARTSVREAAIAFRVPISTISRWRTRYNPEDLTSLECRSRRPNRTRQRWWTAAQEEAVLALRRAYPRMGKMPLRILLLREGIRLSASMIGRILGSLRRRNVRLAPHAARVRKQRPQRPYATRVPKDKRAPTEPGALIQLDTMHLRPLPGVERRQFTAIDVVTRCAVVGGGPAGSATAIWCARRGLRVVVIERSRFPRHRPGETLVPGIEPLFHQLGVAAPVAGAGFIRQPGTWVTWSGPRRFDAYGADAGGPWLGFQAPRDQLDGILLAAAVAAGATVYQPSRAVTPVLDGRRVTGVTTGDTPIMAPWVVDAGGGQHWLARHLELTRQFASPRLVARYGYVRGCRSNDDGIPEIVADETGWTWTARIGPDLHHWTRLSFADDDPWQVRPPVRLDSLTMLDRPRGADVTWRIIERAAGPGYVCAGDAAAVLDPASSHGVLKTIMSGMMASHVIAENPTGSASPTAAIDAYTDWLTGHFTADVATLMEMYRSLPHPPPWVRDEGALPFTLREARASRAGQ